jgi:hypothetical protein
MENKLNRQSVQEEEEEWMLDPQGCYKTRSRQKPTTPWTQDLSLEYAQTMEVQRLAERIWHYLGQG